MLHRTRQSATLRSTTNPHDRRGLAIWLEGEKAGASRFFRFWSTRNAGLARALNTSTNQLERVCSLPITPSHIWQAPDHQAGVMVWATRTAERSNGTRDPCPRKSCRPHKWMEQPNPYLDGESPIELAERVEGANRVLEYIRNWIAQSTQPSAPDAGVSSAIDECLLLADGCPLWRAAIGQKRS